MSYGDTMDGFVRSILVLALVFSQACSDVETHSDVDDATDESAPPLTYRASAEAAAESIGPDWIADWLESLADDAMAGRDNQSTGGERARDYLLAELEAMGVEPAGTSGWLQPFAAGVNVIARIPGRDPDLSHEHVIVSAHYDHLGTVGAPDSQCRIGADPADLICNGAADNASGVAAVLAVARALSDSPLGVRRSVVFAFWDAEEDGLLGSTWFVDEAPVVALEDVVAMFTLDNVGTEIVPGFDGTFAMGAEFSDGLDAESIAERLRRYLEDPPETQAEWDDYQAYIESVIDLVYSTL